MAMGGNNLNMIEMLRAGLEKQVKEAVTESLVKQELKEFEAKLRTDIKPIVDRITFTGIDSLKDLMRIREELHVFIHWDDGKSEI